MAHKNPKEILKEKNLWAKKSFGQNFLIDDHHLNVIAKAACSLRQDNDVPIFEIGAGLGALTHALLEQGAIVNAIERDRDLIPILNQEFKDQIATGKLILHEANATTFDFSKINKSAFVLCGNLPYHLTSSLMFKALEIYESLLGAVFMIQSEVAMRIVSKPGNKVYGLLSVLLQSRFDVSMIHQVPKGAFWPIPKVDSSVIQMIPKPKQPNLDWPSFEKIVKMAFSTRRKTLKNALSNLENAEQKMNVAQIDPTDRAENLTVEDFIRLSHVKG